VAKTSQAATNALKVTPALQNEFAQLTYHYAAGADLAGAGDHQGSVNEFRKAFADDAVSEYVFPPNWSHLNTTVKGGGAGLAQFATDFVNAFGLVRLQHMITNVVVTRTGPTTAVMRSYALAIHVYPDEHVFNATVKYLDDVRLINGQWKFVHRVVTLTSMWEAPTWTGAPPPPR
jgi:hypothetical protein